MYAWDSIDSYSLTTTSMRLQTGNPVHTPLWSWRLGLRIMKRCRGRV